MKKLSVIRKTVVTMACLAFAVVGTTLIASAATSATITAHTVPAWSTTEYWNGTNGTDIGAGGHIYFNETFDNYYTADAGWHNVGNDTWSEQSYVSGSSTISFSATVPSTSLYRAYLSNDTSVPIHVTGGHLSTT